MSRVDIEGLIENYKGRTTVYTPIVEAVVNSIQAIEVSGRKDGHITIIVKRAPQMELGLEPGLRDIDTVIIEDNGIGFTQENRTSFDTVFSRFKRDIGGKGFGRFTFQKYFKNITVESIYNEEGIFYQRKFYFGKKDVIIEDEQNAQSKAKDTLTALTLGQTKDIKLEKELPTIARKLVESLLIYFIREDYKCPVIELKEDGESAFIVLNEYISGDKAEIRSVAAKSFELSKTDGKKELIEKFEAKIFKFYYRKKQSTINLTADNREVTAIPLHAYVPEFIDEFFEDYENSKGETSTRDYSIKTYVIGPYLDKHVLSARGSFEFSLEDDLSSIFSQEEIEKKAAEITKTLFNTEVKTRQEKKIRRIREYVEKKAPWHKPYFGELDISKLPYNLNEEGMELELQKIKYNHDREARDATQKAIADKSSDLSESIITLMKTITASKQSDLAHYVCNRRLVIDLFMELLTRNDDGSAKYEKDIHNLIFPMGKDSTNIDEKDHNLWLLDDRLIFSQFIASDKKINKKTAKGEPDLVFFNHPQSFRAGDNQASNPLTIFEFKRPKRVAYKDDEDPIKQIGDYLLDIRDGKYETPNGVEKIIVKPNTPVYGYLVCDLTDRVRYFAEKIHQLKPTPDDEGYFGNLGGFEMVITIISFKKLLTDAKMRNVAFFKLLGIQ